MMIHLSQVDFDAMPLFTALEIAWFGHTPYLPTGHAQPKTDYMVINPTHGRYDEANMVTQLQSWWSKVLCQPGILSVKVDIFG